MKKKLNSRSLIFITLSVGVGMILGLIYLFQTSYLDTFYRLNKIRLLSETSHEIVSKVDAGDLEELVESLQLSNEVCVRVVSSTSDVLGESMGNACALRRLNQEQIADIYMNTDSSSNKERLFDNFLFEMGHYRADLYIYSSITMRGGDEVLIMVSSTITPLTATTETLRSQYKVIAGIVVLITLILAYVLSKIIVSPIRKIKEEASSLPNGRYSGNIETPVKEIEELNETLISANDEINKAERAKKELLANVSHDLRTPLTMIKGYAELIKDFKEENNDENLDVIISETERLSELVNDLLDMSALADNRMTLKISDVSVSDLISQVHRQYSEYCRSNDIDFKMSVECDGNFKADHDRLLRVLYNFVSNAINHNDAKHKEITIGSYKVDGVCRIYVKDNGSGVKKEDVSQVFDRYYKVDKEHKRTGIGSGIGLSLSKEILLTHGFDFGVEGDHLSVFYFDIVL